MLNITNILHSLIIICLLMFNNIRQGFDVIKRALILSHIVNNQATKVPNVQFSVNAKCIFNINIACCYVIKFLFNSGYYCC